INENMYRELTGSETGLVAYYKMSNGSGSTLSDNKSGGTNTGTINGATWTASGALSGSKMALDFDGSDDQVQFQSNSPAYNNTALTIEAWMKSTNAGENKELVSWGDASGSNIVEFKMDEGKLKFGINVSSAESVWGSQAINTGKWVHVAVVKDNSNITLYVNGVVDTTGTLTQSPSVDVMTIANLYQNGTYSTTNLFSGMLDEVRIWNTARTKSQIRESMMKTLEGNEDGLIAYYRFDHYGGTTLYDISGHGKNGTLTNMDAATDWVSSDAFNTWLGGESNEWSTAANWSNGAPSSDQSFGIYDWSSTLSGVTTVPSFPSTLSVNNLRIPSGITPSGSLGLTADGSVLLGSDLTLSTSTVGKLMIENGGSITLPTGATLTVNNQLNIESDATGTGSFIIHGTMSGSGTFNVERYIEGRSWSTTPIYWHLLSSPVQDQEISAFETTGTGNDYGFYGWSEIHNLWINYKNTSNPPTFSEWNDGTNFVQGRGYLVSYEQTQSGKKFTGTPYNTDKTWSNLSYSSGSNYGWHLLGNPFPSALKWNESTYWALSNVAGTAKIWHCTNNAYSDINSNGIIPISQGFMIQVNGANNSITIPLASRVHNNTAWYKAGDANRLLLVASPTDGSSAQESVIRIEEGSTNDFDFYYDSRFLAGYAPLFYCIVGNEILSTQAVPSIEEGMEFLYGFIKNDRQEFKIRLAENPFPMRVYLEDLKTGVTQCLSDNPEYVFTSVEGDAHNRFKLHMGSVGIDEPNPTKVFAYAVGKQLYFTFGGEKRVEIFNTAGQMLMHLTTAQNQIPLPLSSGIYIVRITTDQQTVFNKIFIRK
ncbi:MAG TPA: T9SS type A sorting domain-containing protein, partial [Bacteroidales bacterium]|nr:T9SS type A sorting domain-containing protein [Bacteroidales bacterium]